MPTRSNASDDALSAGELAAWRGMLRVNSRLIRELDDELQRDEGLPLSSYQVLILLQDAPDQRMRISEISDAGVLSLSGVSRLVDRLVRDGLVVKAPCDQDRRGAFAVLSDAGVQRLRTARPAHRRAVRRCFLDNLSEREIEDLGELWRRLGSGEPPV